MQPQHQPQTEQTPQNQNSSPTEPLLRESSSVQSSADLLHAPPLGIPDSGKEHNNEAPQDQKAQISDIHGENNIKSTNTFPESKNEPSVPEAVNLSRYSSLSGSSTTRSQKNLTPVSSNEQSQTATVGDVAPIFLHATPAAESYVGSPEAQRRNSTASSNRTPTQEHFSISGQDDGLSGHVLLDEQAYFQKEQNLYPSFESELARGPEDRENENHEEYKREVSAPQSHDSAHTSPSMEITHESNADRQASDLASGQQFSEPSEEMFPTYSTLVSPQGIPEAKAQSATHPQVFSQGKPQESVLRGDSVSQKGLIPPSRLQSPSTGSQRVARPFSFIAYSHNQPTQPRPEVLQRAPSIESISRHQHLDHPPSPVSPQRSMTRDVSEEHGQITPTHYDASHNVLPADNGNDLLRRPRSFSRPFQDPNLLEHPAFRHEGPQARGADIPAEYYSPQRPREEIRLPRQQTTEYQLEGVGPPLIPRTETKSRSRHSSRSSVFFRNLGNSAKVEGPSKTSPEAQYVEPPAKDVAARRKKSNRNSVFRTLTGRSGNDRDQTSANGDQPVTQPQNVITQQPISMSPEIMEKDLGSGGTSSKVRNKLQRASTSGAPEKSKTVGKKKRFSAIGVGSY